MTRFIFVLWSLAPGGTLGVLRQVWPRLEDEGPIRIITHGPDAASCPYPVRTVGDRRSHPYSFPGVWLYVWRVMRACLAEARRGGPVVLLPQDSVATGAAAVIAGRLAGVPVVVMEHGSAVVIRGEYFWRERIGRRRLHAVRLPLLRASVWLLNRICMRFASGTLIPGDEAVPLYRAAGQRPDRVLRYHIPVDLDAFRAVGDTDRRAARAALGLPAGGPIAATISRLTPEKGIEVIIDAVAQVPPDARPVLVVAGDGPLRGALESRAAGHGIDARFVGNLDRGAVATLLAASDLFCYGGIEGTNTPVAVLEAMAAGLPVVGGRAPASIGDLLADGRGAAVASGSVDEMAEALERLLRDPDRGREAGRLARAHVEATHSPEVFAAEFDRFLSWYPPRR